MSRVKIIIEKITSFASLTSIKKGVEYTKLMK